MHPGISRRLLVASAIWIVHFGTLIRSLVYPRSCFVNGLVGCSAGRFLQQVPQLPLLVVRPYSAIT
jgi:hypothetical protein